jgi:hypothetical protein
MKKFNTGVIEMFMWKWTAQFYAWRARRAGYTATVVYQGENWLLLGGRWGVSLDKSTGASKREKEGWK